MGTHGGGGGVDGVPLRRGWMACRCNNCKPYWSRVEIPTRMQIFFSLIFVRIHTKIVIQTVYYEFVHCVVFVPIHTFFYTNCIVRIHTTSREGAVCSAPRGRNPRGPSPRHRDNGRFAPSLTPGSNPTLAGNPTKH